MVSNAQARLLSRSIHSPVPVNPVCPITPARQRSPAGQPGVANCHPSPRRTPWITFCSVRSAATLSGTIEKHLREYFDGHNGALPPRGLYDRVLRELERPLITLTLLATRGNQVKAAEVLGLNRNTLRKKIRELDIGVMRGAK